MSSMIHSFRSRYSVFFALLSALFCMPLAASTPKLQEELGASSLEILQNPKFVTIISLVKPRGKNASNHIKEVYLNSDEIERLKRNILDDHNYKFGKPKKCHFFPEISLKFIDDKDQIVHLYVSPECNQMLFGMDTHSVMLDYDPVHERLENYFMELITETINRNKEKTS